MVQRISLPNSVTAIENKLRVTREKEGRDKLGDWD